MGVGLWLFWLLWLRGWNAWQPNVPNRAGELWDYDFVSYVPSPTFFYFFILLSKCPTCRVVVPVEKLF